MTQVITTKKMDRLEPGASDIVKAKSSGEGPRATAGLVFNLTHPRVNETKQQIIVEVLFESDPGACELPYIHCRPSVCVCLPCSISADLLRCRMGSCCAIVSSPSIRHARDRWNQLSF